MNHEDQVRELMEETSQARQTAQKLVYDPQTKQLRPASSEEASKRGLLTVEPEDMKVSM